MAFESFTDEQIKELLSCAKRLTNPGTRAKQKFGHDQVNYKVVATDGTDHQFELYTRQNLAPGMESGFSCGLSWVSPSGETLTLVRYNGAAHEHMNKMEGEQLDRVCHIHRATERYIKAGKKAEGFAEATTKFSTLKGALHCLVIDTNIKGISTEPDLPVLF